MSERAGCWSFGKTGSKGSSDWAHETGGLLEEDANDLGGPFPFPLPGTGAGAPGPLGAGILPKLEEGAWGASSGSPWVPSNSSERER